MSNPRDTRPTNAEREAYWADPERGVEQAAELASEKADERRREDAGWRDTEEDAMREAGRR